MEDIKLGRQTVASTFSGNFTNGQSMVIPANPRRVGIMLSGPCTVAGTECRIFTGSTAIERNFLYSLNPAKTSVTFRIEEYGTLVQQQLLLNNGSGLTIPLSYTEMILLENPNGIGK